MRGAGTDGLVVAMKPGNAGGAKGPDTPPVWRGQPAMGGARSTARPAWLEWKSRMRREPHVRSCEGGGVKSPPLLDSSVRRTTGWSGRAVNHTRLVLLVVATMAGGAEARERESASTGTPVRGSLQDGVSLPVDGDGFVTYSRLGNWLGRQYVNSRVRDTLGAAFKALHARHPDRVFVVGETGLQKGGRFRPHRSHQNGLSVDVFMPVRNGQGERVLMPTAAWQKFGYSLEFDTEGKGGEPCDRLRLGGRPPG